MNERHGVMGQNQTSVTNGAFRMPDASVLTSSHTPRIQLCDAEINRFTKKISAELSQMTHEYVLQQLYWA